MWPFSRSKIRKPANVTPFAGAIYDYLLGTSTLDDCAQILRTYEKKWGVEIISPNLTADFTEHGVTIHEPVRLRHLSPDWDAPTVHEQYLVKQYYPFLTETHCYLTPQTYADLTDVIVANKYFITATHRAWGRILADWANSTRYQGRENWNYCAFAFSAHYYRDYGDKWEDAVYDVLGYKTVTYPADATCPPA